MITVPTLGVFPSNSADISLKSNSPRNGSVFELLLGSRDQQSSNRGSREGSMGPPSRTSSNASATSLSSLQEVGGSQFFEVLYLGKIKSVSHKKAPPTFIDDVLEIFRAHNIQEQQKNGRQFSLPVSNTCQKDQVSSARMTGKHAGFDDTFFSFGDYEVRSTKHTGTKLLDTKEEEEFPENQSAKNASDPPPAGGDTLAILKQTEEVLKNLSDRMESQETRGSTAFGRVEIEDRLAKFPETLPPPFRVRTSSGDNLTLPPRNNLLTEMRGRASSMGSNTRPKRVGSFPCNMSDLQRTQQNNSAENNRTMLFQISRIDVKLISPDRKSVLLSKPFRDISHCSQGIQHPDNFGFICRDANSENYVCYVFKCLSSSVADEITAVLKQAAQTAAETQKRAQPNVCEHCPTVWLQRLVADIEGLSEQKAHAAILKRISNFPENEQQELMTKFQGADLIKTKEQNDLLLMLLRAHCESRQMTHVHDTAENRHEFLNQYLDRGSGAIFQKAKRSLSNSFDQLLKRRSNPKEEATNGQTGTLGRDLSLPVGIFLTDESTPTKQAFRFDMSGGFSQSPLNGPLSPTETHLQVERADSMLPLPRQRSSTLCSSYGETIKKELKDIQKRKKIVHEDEAILPQKTDPPPQCYLKPPIIEKFGRGGHQPHLSLASPGPEMRNGLRTPSPRRTGSWRQAIFQQVKTPNQNGSSDFKVGDKRKDDVRTVRTSRDYRDLWKKAIRQQILLVRMEKENKRLRAHQEEMTIKRMKLNYDEIAACSRAVARHWDKLLGHSFSGNSSVLDFSSLTKAVEDGVPKPRRGEIWRLLVNARNSMEMMQTSWHKHAAYDDYSHLCREPIDYDQFPFLDVPYEELLRELTSHQHLIIIDLGRTFPTHLYYATSLGPGQLSLFNLLKAYSLLDSQVGYCQGLSFIGAVLLLHLDEKDAYYMLRYLMLELGLRRQYLPDMAALQVQLYQMARLLRDEHRDLYEHLEQNEVSPSLYAAPWFLTLFASQFPLGFVVRVFDLIFLSGISMVFRVAAALLADHKEMLLQCRNFEQLMDYFKTTLPCMGATQLERVIHEALALDIGRQLAAYEVEYHVLQEEMSAGLASPPSSPHPISSGGSLPFDSPPAKWDRLDKSNQVLQKQVRDLQNQLQSSKTNYRVLEANLTAQQAMYTRLERQLHDCEADRTALIQLVTDLSKHLSLGDEVVVPPCLVKCFQEFKLKGGSAAATAATPITGSDFEGISFTAQPNNSTDGCVKSSAN